MCCKFNLKKVLINIVIWIVSHEDGIIIIQQVHGMLKELFTKFCRPIKKQVHSTAISQSKRLNLMYRSLNLPSTEGMKTQIHGPSSNSTAHWWSWTSTAEVRWRAIMNWGMHTTQVTATKRIRFSSLTWWVHQSEHLSCQNICACLCAYVLL